MAIIATGRQSVNGTSDADIIVLEEERFNLRDTVTGGDGNDLIIGDLDATFEDVTAANSTFGTATNIDSSPRWSTQSNPLVADDTVPYVTVLAEGQSALDFFKVTVGAGETLIADIDFAVGPVGGPSFDSMIELIAEDETTVLADNDDADSGLGGAGSFQASEFDTTSRDSFLTFTNSEATAQTWAIKVGQFSALGITAIDAGATYVLTVSVTNHDNTNIAVQGQDDILAGDGDDFLIGNDGNDTLNGQNDNDTLLGGAGDDTLRGGFGDDFVDGGAGDDSLNLGTGTDTLLGGSGDDTVYINALNIAQAGDILDGGDNTSAGDTLDFSTLVPVVTDVTGASITGFETLKISLRADATDAVTLEGVYDGSPNLLRMTAAQFAQFEVIEVLLSDPFADINGSENADIEIVMGDETEIDVLDRIFQFDGFAEARFTIIGDDDDEVLLGSPLGDTINGNGGDDFIQISNGGAANGGSGDDQLLYRSFEQTDIVSATFDGGDNTATGDQLLIGLNGTFDGLQSADFSGSTITGIEEFVFEQAADTGAFSFTSSQLASVERLREGNSGTSSSITVEFDKDTALMVDDIDYTGLGSEDLVLFRIGDFTKIVTGGSATSAFGAFSLGNDVYNNFIPLGTDRADLFIGGASSDFFKVSGGTDTLVGGEGADLWTIDDPDALIEGLIINGDAPLDDGSNDVIELEGLNSFFDLTPVTMSGIDVVRFYLEAGGFHVAFFTASQFEDLDTFSLFDRQAGEVAEVTVRMGSETELSLAGITFENFTSADLVSITGDDDAEVITGGTAAEFFLALGGDDSIDGGIGDDTILGGLGDDTIVGGADTDVAVIGADSRDVTVFIGAGGLSLVVASGQGIDEIDQSVENIQFNDATFSYLDLALRSSFGETFTGDDDPDDHTSGTGNDTLTGDGGNDTLSSGDGNDSIVGGAGEDSLSGGNDNDIIKAGDNSDTVDAGRGNDTVYGGAGADDIRAGVGDDFVRGEDSRDFLRGGRGEDTLDGGAGNDSIVGQRNADTLEGGGGADTLKGGGGNDLLNGNGGADFLKGGTRADVINGGFGDDRIIGNSFGDVLNGDQGNDNLNAGGQNDTLNGGSGNDTLKGGADADLFIFGAGMDADIVTDFTDDVDTLRISSDLTGGDANPGSVLDRFADVIDGSVVINFGSGDVITLQGFTDINALSDDLEVF